MFLSSRRDLMCFIDMTEFRATAIIGNVALVPHGKEMDVHVIPVQTRAAVQSAPTRRIPLRRIHALTRTAQFRFLLAFHVKQSALCSA